MSNKILNLTVEINNIILDSNLKISNINTIDMLPEKKRLNDSFIELLGELTDILQRQGEPFKARAYQQAQETIMVLTADIYSVAQLKGLKGIGKAIEGKLEEFSKTGTLKILEEERNNPLNLLTRIYGVGPKKAKELVDKGITNLDKLKAQPELLNDTQRIGLKYFDAIEMRIPRCEIDDYKEQLSKTFLKVTPPGSSYEIVGSYRRGAQTSGDIDVIITNAVNNQNAFTLFIDKLIHERLIIEVLSRGNTKSLVIAQLPGKTPRRVDFLYSPPTEYAFALLYFTGSKIFNTLQRQRALVLGYTLNEHGLNYMVEKTKGKAVVGEFPDEKSIFAFLGMVYKEPSERKDSRSLQFLPPGASTSNSTSISEPMPQEAIAVELETAVPKVKKSEKLSANLSRFKKEGISALALLFEKDLSELLRAANMAYYKLDTPIMSDNEYDIIREHTRINYPENKAALEGHTKCSIKVDKNKVKLPYEMWSMNKIKPDTTNMLKWKKKYVGPFMISCKLDGISALYSTENKELKLYTRGDGLIGQDISHLIPYLQLPVYNTLKGVEDLVVRGEIIIKKAIFQEKYAKQFANPRNFVAGVVNQKTLDPSVIADLSFIPYEVIKPETIPSMGLHFSLGRDPLYVRHIICEHKEVTNENLSTILVKWREESEYEIDGIICLDDNIHPRVSGNPPHAFAFKMVLSDQIAEALVTDVIWTPSKDGYLKPRVQIEPVTLGGVTIEYATGFNARFIVEKNIGVGALIRLIRSGDVIPHITDVIQPATQPLLPIVPYEWNETGVDILLTDKVSDATVKEKTISGFFSHLAVDGLGPGNIKRMIDAGYDTVPKILALTEEHLLQVEGFQQKLAHKIYTNIAKQIVTATLPELMHASNIFGRGFGTKKLQLILDAYPDILTDSSPAAKKVEEISELDGLAKKTAEQFVKEIPAFIRFLTSANLTNKLVLTKEASLSALANANVNKDHPLYGKKWVMTGFRDKDLIQDLLSVGSEQGASVNKKTVLLIVKDLAEENGKVVEAQKNNIPIMTAAQVRITYGL